MNHGSLLSIDDLLGLGLAPKTAYLYARLIDRTQTFLAEAGTDLATCGPAELAMAVQRFQNTHSARQQVRSAVIAAWDILGRHDGPGGIVMELYLYQGRWVPTFSTTTIRRNIQRLLMSLPAGATVCVDVPGGPHEWFRLPAEEAQ